MAVYSVEGKLGTGKTKFCVWRAQQALRKGLRVASNVDLFLEYLVPEIRTATYQRIPDKPTSRDLDAIGHGNPESYNEERNGVLILDELGSWLNSRSFQDKDRLAVIDWLIHARKKGWDVYLIVQDAQMIDKQVREALIEYHVRCVRLDKVKVPVVGGILGILHERLAYMPRMHSVTARVGEGTSKIVAERWLFRGDDLHKAYDTRQIFKHSPDDCTRTMLHAHRFVAPLRKRSFFEVLRGVQVERKPPKPKLRVVELLMKLPEPDRLRHWRRLSERGVI